MAFGKHGDILSLWKRQTSMRRKLMFFSLVLFLFIFLIGSGTFVFLMGRILHDSAAHELSQSVEIERLKLEASVNSEIAVVLKMASSPLIQKYFLNPKDEEIRKIALEDIAGYRKAFSTNRIFWINDIDKEFYYDDGFHYPVDPNDPVNYWYNLTLYGVQKFNFNVNYNYEMKTIMFWINAPVFDNYRKPIGMVGSGIDLLDFAKNIYKDYRSSAELYFFNAAGEITGATDTSLITNKVTLSKELGKIGEDIFSRIKDLKSDKIHYFEFENSKGGIVLGTVPSLGWYVTAILPFTIADSLRTNMAMLFVAMMLIIAFIFIIFNLFVIGLLRPLNKMVKSIDQISADWNENSNGEIKNKDEIETLGKLFNIAIHDPLTGVYNRRFMDGSMKKIIKSLSRTRSKLSLLMVDIDFFKKYNDNYGHIMGDNCLKTIANVLNETITRDEDFVARYGGEEFIVVLPNTDENGAQIIAEKLLKRIQECNIAHEKSAVARCITVSIGGTTGTVSHLQSGNTYIRRADMALYKSKQRGRNQYNHKEL
ncbi:MAG: GGDEF domain-containing protein [Fibromonadaceae bacterium]|jgi:methyl-accepting chemotaxis protein|nr:GGDEF domain-containing protein [Fibromonadaceae bacterium]